MSKKALRLIKGDKFILTNEMKEAAYEIYPRKGDGKKAGMEKLSIVIKDMDTYQRFMQAVNNYAALIKKSQTERQFIKYWSTFVNNWEDYENAADLGLTQTSTWETF